MSGRYIDADALAQQVCVKLCTASNCSNVLKIIHDMPTADVRQNVHGAWIEDGYTNESIVCSYCGEPSNKRTNFCPECGSYNGR